MDPITQNVNQNIDAYFNNLVAECLQAPGIVNLPQEQKDAFVAKLHDHFSDITLAALINKLNGEQLSQIENLDPTSPEMAEKIQQLAAQVPGLAEDMEKKLQESVAYIKQNSKIPQTTT